MTKQEDVRYIEIGFYVNGQEPTKENPEESIIVSVSNLNMYGGVGPTMTPEEAKEAIFTDY